MNAKALMAAAESGHDYVATPGTHCYINRPYSVISLEKAYSFEPVLAALDDEKRSHCLGLQGNMWSEHIPTPAEADHMVWPRLCALAEVGWSPKEARDWTDFHSRMESHAARLKELGVKIDLAAANPPNATKPAATKPAAKKPAAKSASTTNESNQP